MSGEENTWLISDADRNALGVTKEEWNQSDGALYKRREKIRERVVNGTIDYTDVQRDMSDWNWPKFVNLAKEQEGEVREGMESAIALFYELHQSTGWNFQKTLWGAIEKAYTYGRYREMPARTVVDVPFNPDIREPEDIDHMRKRIENKIETDQRLTDREIAWAGKNATKSLFIDVVEHLDSYRDSHRQRVEKAKRKHSVESEAPDE